ncbi:MAG: DUF2029 domain-containing protein [Blastocatellia bacterium]|nr:DUF2029 domain-containing protein [Blastocatellia bacterium]
MVKSSWQQRIKALCLVLLLLTLVEFIVRGPLRAISLSSDLAVPYLAARAWRTGGNPYDHDTLDHIWREAGGAPAKKPRQTTTPSVYPPTTLILLSPLTIMPWRAARYCVLIINIAFTIMVIRSLLSIAHFDPADWRPVLFWAIVLGLAPLQTGIALGNLIVPSASLALLSVSAAMTKNVYLSGILLALSMCLKPQIGGIFWLSCALQRRWRICAIGAVAGLLLALIAILHLWSGQIDWVDSWVRNYRDFAAAGGSNDPTALNPSRHHLLNLQLLLHTFFEERWLANLSTLVFVGSQFSVLCFAGGSGRSKRKSLLNYCVMILLGLLASYHRFYDATLLILPLFWSLRSWSGVHKMEARLSFLLIIPFLLPGAVILKESLDHGYLPHTWKSSWWWNSILLTHQVWLLAFLSLCLTFALTRGQKSEVRSQKSEVRSQRSEVRSQNEKMNDRYRI